MAVSYSLGKGGDAYGKRALGENPSLCGMLSGSLMAAGLHIPKCVLAARTALLTANGFILI